MTPPKGVQYNATDSCYKHWTPSGVRIFKMTDSSETSQPTAVCDRCGHPDGAHLFNAATEYPSEGWVTCPEPGCECYATWSLDEKSKPAMDRIRDDYYKGISNPKELEDES